MMYQGALRPVFGRWLVTLAAVLLAGSAGAGAAPGAPEFAYVLIGAQGQPVARALTLADTCPVLRVDGHDQLMTLRAEAAQVPDRGGKQSDHKLAEFAVRTCEASLPAGARQASVAGVRLPLPKRKPQRIVVIGDTGCRMKASEDAFQACSDHGAWPFPVIAQRAAAWHPDLVIHLGDYHYRESPCPPDMAGCTDSPWGYGYDAWKADLFEPAQPLMQAAPWVMVRGNHESCSRAGQGWQRFLAPQPFDAGQSCDDPALDAEGDHASPYAVALTGSTQLIVFDSSRAAGKPLAPDDETFQRYAEELRAVDQLVTRAPHNIFLSHHPVLGFGSGPNFAALPGNASMQSVMRSLHPERLYPAGIDLAMHGHIHLFEALRFDSDHPSVFVAGNSGSALAQPLPDRLPPGSEPSPETRLAAFLTRSGFGYLTMAYRGRRWHFVEYDVAGRRMARCVLQRNRLDCRAEPVRLDSAKRAAIP